MIKTVLTKVLGNRHEREVKRLRPLVEQIHQEEERLRALDDQAIQGQTVHLRGHLNEMIGDLRTKLEELREAKHACPDPVEREELEEQFHEQERRYRTGLKDALEAILPEAFATVREACRRLVGSSVQVTGQELTWDMVPYDVQLIGGIILHRGRIAEMATGEGKTLVAVLPLYLNALSGHGAHLVTVNNYLARRDSQWMGHVFRWLGLTVACLDDTEPSSPERRAAYLADITYGTNNEFGFDYLRDNMVFSGDHRVQREHNYAIIDEVDSILIDEARTPLIISGPVGNEGEGIYGLYNRQIADLTRKQSTVVSNLIAEAEGLIGDEKTRYDGAVKLYQAQLGMPKSKRLAKILNEHNLKTLVQKVELDALADRKLPARQQRLRGLEEVLFFVLDEKGHSVHLTDQGASALSPDDPALFLVPDISEAIHAIERDPELSAAERIEERRKVEADYASKSEKLHVIHKLLQAHALYEKDVDYLVQDNQVLIVDEFTGRVMAGRRWADGLHQAVEAKEGVQVKGETQTLATITIQNYFRMYHKLSGMTGTAETEENEFFQIYGLDVSVVPTHRPIRRSDMPDLIYRTRREKFNAVVEEVERLHGKDLPVLIGTTNVEVSETLSRQLKRRGLPHEVLNAKYHQREAEIVAKAGQRGSITIATNMAGRGTDIKLGADLDLEAEEAGLQIVGTERHESRRIDRQLRGRSGRQGDPGRSIFFLSLEDDLMRLFGADRIARYMERSGAEEGEVITGRLVTTTIESAQKRVELQNFQQRKRLLEYDDVMNQQREVIYSLRLFALERGEELKAEARRMIQGALEQFVAGFLGTVERAEQYDRVGLGAALSLQYLLIVDDKITAEEAPDLPAIQQAVSVEGEAAFKRKVEYLQEFGRRINVPDVDLQVLSQVMLSVLDEKWKDHLYDLDQLRNAIHYRSYGQKDPLVEYKREAFEMFEDLMRDIYSTFAERYLKIQVNVDPRSAPPPPRQPPAQVSKPVSEGMSADDLFQGGVPSVPGRRAAATAAAVSTSLGKLTRDDQVPEVGRNDPCPCGSGRKYKKCHGSA